MKREPRTKGTRTKPLEHKRDKKRNRERPAAIIPLTDADRAPLIGFERGAAELHYYEARAIAKWGGAPNACVHSIYYAMYHAAAAVLYIHGGVGKKKDVPKSHEHVLEHFTKLAQQVGGEAPQAAQLLNRSRSARMTADYGGAESPDEDEVERVIDDGIEFIGICVKHLKLPPFSPPPVAEQT